MSEKEREISKEVYGDDYSAHYFEQYKLYIEGIEKISDRRESANKYFVTLNSGIIVAIGFLIQNFKNKPHLVLSLLMLSFLGIIISVIFWYLINSYKQLNSGKFRVLHEIEKKLPIALYAEEWNILEKGKNRKLYLPFSHIERMIPTIFGILYFLSSIYLIICIIYKYYGN